MPSYQDFILPAVRATADLGGSAQSRQIADRVLADFDPSPELLAITYPHRPEDPILFEKIAWVRSYVKLIGALESPRRGVFLVTPLGRELLAMPVERARSRALRILTASTGAAGGGRRLRRPSIRRSMGTAPISPVLSSRVAVQVKRYDPTGRPIGRDVVSLFQNDARRKGAERAILVTLGRFSEPGSSGHHRRGSHCRSYRRLRLCDLVREQRLGVKDRPHVDPHWFDRFDRSATRRLQGTEPMQSTSLR